jgi:hypothetical protein
MVEANDIDGAKRVYLKAVKENNNRTPSWATEWLSNDHDIDEEIMRKIKSEIIDCNGVSY